MITQVLCGDPEIYTFLTSETGHQRRKPLMACSHEKRWRYSRGDNPSSFMKVELK